MRLVAYFCECISFCLERSSVLRITVLPALINILSGLEILLVGCNPLESISEDLLPGLPKLTVLDVGFSEILTQLPDSFHKSVELRILKAGNGRLSSLPASLFKCIKLEELYLYGNCLKDIGEELQCLENLRILNLGRNQIVKLPLGLGKLTALEILHVYENCLSSLPPGVRSLGKLQTLNAQSNEALPIPPRDVRCLADAKATAAFLASGNVN